MQITDTSLHASTTDKKSNFTSSSTMRTSLLSANLPPPLTSSHPTSGVMNPPVEMVTDDGYDLQFGTNVLGHFYFTKLLLPTLLATAKTSPEGTVRVVNTSSNAHWMGGLKFDTFKDGLKRRKESTYTLYGQSKTVSTQ